MTRPIRLVLTLHNHQPIGNFDGVFESAYRESYLPFLDVLEKYPDLNVVLHTSGSLLEWLVERHPEYIDRVRNLAQRGQVEIIGGPFFEPILAELLMTLPPPNTFTSSRSLRAPAFSNPLIRLSIANTP